MVKKHHHYVSEAYLKSFCDRKGRICLYRKDNPRRMIRTTPRHVCRRKFYYSQPTPGGGKDYNRLEDFFSQFERKWPGVVKRLEQRENVKDCLRDIRQFIALQRARVPAARDASEEVFAGGIQAALRTLDGAGRLPDKPKGHEDILVRADVSVNPHLSIHAMKSAILDVGEVLQRIGIGALHNETEAPFLTSDNPVIWFDPSVAEDEMKPYCLRKGGEIVLLFPVTPRVMIFGHSSKREQFAKHGFRHGTLSKRTMAEEMNHRICQFAYEAVLAQDPGQEDLIRRYADVSPVIKTETTPCQNGWLLTCRWEWGRRKRKPKWRH